MKYLMLLPIIPFAVSLCSCATDDEEPIPVTKSGEVMKPRLVGRIASVPSDKRFILIQSYGDWKVSSGSILISHGSDGRTANLLATGEVMGQYAAADIQSGEVNVGDAVYYRDLTKQASPSQPENPAPQAGPEKSSSSDNSTTQN